MGTSLSLIASGSFTSTGAARNIVLPSRPDYFKIVNRSTWGTAPTDVIQSEWFYGYADGQAITITEGGGSALTGTAVAAGGTGFTFVDSTVDTPIASYATGTAITAANPAVVSDANTPTVGDTVVLYNTTGMLQIAGMPFTVTAVTAGVDFTLGYLDASGFAAAATNADYRIFRAPYWNPDKAYIVGITAANPAVISTSTAHDYAIGDKIRVTCPAAFGMVEIDGLEATITAVTANTITTDINSAAFTAFAFPTSAVAAAGVDFPMLTSAGEEPDKVLNPTVGSGEYRMHLGAAIVGANTDVMDWMAFKRDYTV